MPLLLFWTLAATATDVGEIAARSQDLPEFHQLLNDLTIEVALQLKEKKLGAMAIEEVRALDPLGSEAAAMTRVALSRALKGAGVTELFCAPCDGAARLVLEDPVHSHRALGREVGASVFLQVTLEHTQDAVEHLVLAVTAIDADDERIVFATRVRSDDARTGLIRLADKPETVNERTEALKKDVKERSLFGHAAIMGILRIPFKVTGTNFPGTYTGTINGTTFAYRFYELFGAERRIAFGLQVQGFIDLDFGNNLPKGSLETGQTLPASGALFSAVFAYTFGADDLRMPRLRVGGLGGAFIGGSLGNTAFGGVLVEALMRYRFGLNFALIFIGDAATPIDAVRITIGGLSWMLGGSFNWD